MYAITSSFIGGEVRNAKLSQFIGMPISIVYVAAFMLGISALVLHVFGTSFLGAVGTIDPTKVGLSFAPTYNELTGVLVSGFCATRVPRRLLLDLLDLRLVADQLPRP
jgi:hypothetical protein